MKIGILTWGSNGDVRPFIALASGLGASGHLVTLHIANVDKGDYSDFSTLKNVSLEILPILDRLPEDFQTLDIKLQNAKHPLVELEVVMNELYDPLHDTLMQSARTLCESSDLVIGHCVVHELAIAAEKTRKPRVAVVLTPMIPTRYFSPGNVPKLGGIGNLFFWKLAQKLIHQFQKKRVNDMRVREGLKPVKDVLNDAWLSQQLNLVAVSPSLLPIPLDWEQKHKITGFFNISSQHEQWQMPEDLSSFIDSGPAPVFIGFGSMMRESARTDQTLDIILNAIAVVGCKAIIQTSDAEFRQEKNNNPKIYWLGKAPHQLIFPRCAAVVHHGGAGTTQAATRAGCPQVVVTHIADQPFWAAILQDVGVSPGQINIRNLNARKLARLIRRTLDDSGFRQKAVFIAASMKNENGVESAVIEIENLK